MHKGNVVLVPFPFTDLSGQKVRPALVLYASAKGEDCVVSFISTQPLKGKSVCSVPVSATVANGLKSNSVIRVDKIATLQKKIVLGELGTLESSVLVLVDKTLKELFSL